jgi:uncharacterized repeat protein (TIGR01451 family)
LINVNEESAAGLELVKSVDKTSAFPGELLTYTIIYRNVSSEALSNIVINDATPPYTVFSAASYGTLPLSLTACNITSPGVGNTGTVQWTFTGSLASGAQGVITYVVLIEE